MSDEKCRSCGHPGHNDRRMCGEYKIRTVHDTVSFGPFPPSGKTFDILEGVCQCGTRDVADMYTITDEEKALIHGVYRNAPPTKAALGFNRPGHKVCEFNCDPWSFETLCPVHGDPVKVLDKRIEDMIDYMEEIGMRLVPWQAEAFRAIMKHDGPVRIQGRY